MRRIRAIALVLAAAFAFAACRVGPNYSRPSAPAPPAFKESPPVNFKEAEAAGWKQSQPGDALAKGKWWELYGDPALNALEEQVSISNQNVARAEALYLKAKAEVRVARSALFPTLTTAPTVTVSRPSSGGSGGAGSTGAGGAGTTGTGGANTTTTGGSSSSGVRTSFNLPFDASWEPDLWGRIRRNITAGVANAQAFAADLENAKLLFQAELAQDYFQLHTVDSDAALLRRTEASYQEYLTLTRHRFEGGVATDLDVAQAETQLYDTQSALLDVGVQRAQLEHAIAILIGKAPVELSVPETPLRNAPPPVPVGLPSELLERRPDISASERRVATANEQIGIAIAAFYPTLTLSGSAGLQGSNLGKLFGWPARFWSVGPQLAETLFDAGRRRAVVAEQRAAYDATVADYRQTVLTALQQVEDNLAALRILEIEAAKVDQTIGAATRALDVSTAQYKAGTVSYLNVIISQAALLSAERTAVTLLGRRMTASALLIQALGGGWNESKLPDRQAVSSKSN